MGIIGLSQKENTSTAHLIDSTFSSTFYLNKDKMSDYEDDMDVDDVRTKDKSIQFSGDGNAGKQKRIVADLPVEAEDNLPWYAASKTIRSRGANQNPQGRKISAKHP